MALIGQIAISMTTDARQFNAGIMQATASLRAFSRLGATLGKVSPFTGIGIGAYTATKGFAQIFDQTRKLIPNLLMLGTGVPRELGFNFAKAFGSIGMGLAKTVGGLGIMAVSVGRIGVGLAGWGLGAVARGFGAFTGAVREAINTLGKFAAVASIVAGAALWHVAKGAIALGEQTDRARIVFGEFADTVIAQSKLMATAFGVSRQEFVQAASAFGTIFEGVGYAKKDAADLSVHFVKLATDLSSLVHIPVAEAMEKIQSGLAGQVRPLREVGVFMSEEGIKAKAAAMGLAAVGAELTEQQKVQARIAFITEHLSIATGNLAKTAGSAGNEVRSLAGRFQNLSDTVGTALSSVLGPALDELNVGIQAIQMAWDSSALAAASASVGVLGGTQEQIQGIGILQQSVGFVADAWQAVGLGYAFVQGKITEGIIYLIENLQGFASTVTNIFGVVSDVLVSAFDFTGTAVSENQKHFAEMKTAASDFTATWLDDLKRIGEAQQKTFQMKLAAPAASEGINAAFAASRAKIEAARKELAKPGIDVTKLKPTPDAAKVGKEVKFSGAHIRGTSGEASTVLRSKYSGGRTADETKKISANTAKANEHLSKIAAAVVGGQSLSFMENF